MDKNWQTINEYSVVGSLLVEPQHIGEVSAILKPEHFTSDAMRSVYEAIIKLHFGGKEINPIIVISELGGDYEAAIRETLTLASLDASIVDHAEIIAKQSRLSKIKSAASDLACSETLDAASDAMDALNALMVSRGEVRSVSAADAATEFCSRMTMVPKYLKWGIDVIDERVYAEPGDLILLGGYPSAGKTLLAVQLALSLCESYRVGFFSLETSARKLTDRIMTHMSRVPLPKIKNRNLNEADWAAIAKASEDMSKLPFCIVEASGMSVHDIQAVSLNQRFDVIFVDYLQLINEGGRDRYETVTNISQRLHTFSQSSGVAVVALSQLSRPEKQTGKPKPPTMASFRESGQIEQDADVAFILYPSDPDDNYGTRILKVAKNKEGEKAKIELDFDGATQTMTLHQKTAGEKYRETRKAIVDAGKNCSGQVQFIEIKPNGHEPF